MTSESISPTSIRFIKLGEQGFWEKSCIEGGTLRLGYESPHHQESLAGDWDTVRKFWLAFRGETKAGAVTNDIRQVRDFYELGPDTLWITFYHRKLWWCFAHLEVNELDDQSRIRRTVAGWSCEDLAGNELTIPGLDGRLTKVQGYRGTICEVEKDVRPYLVNKINGKVSRDVQSAQSHLTNLTESVKQLIKGLWWKDFELLTDLIFSQEGWQRTSELGETQKSIDLDMLSPVTGHRAYVQVKSSATLGALISSIEEFKSMEAFDELFFVVHTSDAGIDIFASTCDDPRIHILNVDRLADLVINAGLTRWLINKRS